jgi:hypothetical protein
MTRKCTIFWDVMPWSLVEIRRRFRGTYCINLHIKSSKSCHLLAWLPLRTLKIDALHSFVTSGKL